MSGVLARVGRFFGRNGRTFIGKDLEGNSYYELPPANGGRTKRVVEYRVARDVADYTSGTNRLPVQWTAWLSHTRANPPSIPELQTDFDRRQSLITKIAEIEARETAERIRQGYLPDPSVPTGENATAPRRIVSPSVAAEMGGPGRPGVAGPSRYPAAESPLSSIPPSTTSPAKTTETTVNANASDGKTPVDPPSKVSSPDIAAPRPLVDPSSAASASDLRKLAEEDTKRRIEETKREIPLGEGSAMSHGTGGSLKPRRRGSATA